MLGWVEHEINFTTSAPGLSFRILGVYTVHDTTLTKFCFMSEPRYGLYFPVIYSSVQLFCSCRLIRVFNVRIGADAIVRLLRRIYKTLIFSQTHAYGIEKSLCFLVSGKSIPYRWPCGISFAIYIVRDSSHATLLYTRQLTRDVHVTRFQIIIGWRRVSSSVRLWNADSNFQTLVTILLVHKNIMCEYPCLSWNKRNILVTKLVGFVEIYIFRHFVPAFPCEQREKRALLSACEKKNR